MPRLLFPLALGALLALSAAQAMALGFGSVGRTTALGQPLSFTVGVRLDGDEQLSAECVAAEVFSGDTRLPPSTVRVAVEPGSDPAERTLRVVSNTVIDEPVLSVNLQLTCSNRLARKFVVFIDPPVSVHLAQSGSSSPAPAPAAAAPKPRDQSAAAPAARSEAAVAKAPAKAAQRPPRRVALLPAAADGAAPQAANSIDTPARPVRPRAPATKTARAPAKATGPRLELEAADDSATRERLNLRLTASLASAPAAPGASSPAAALDPDAAQRAKERERLLALEDSLTRLRAESQATQASLAQLQLRLRDAEAQRYANPLVFALAVLAAALAAAVGVLLWTRRRHGEAASEWWTPPADAAALKAEAADDGRPAPAGDLLAPRRLPIDEPPVVETTASPMLLTQVHALAQADAEADTGPRASAPWQEPAHEMSVEELIDLEQQAEFFVVLGQDEAAIDLLMGHLRSSGGASPLPYLKLLEIYRRRNEREAHGRIRERFNRRFNAYAPDWDADPQQGRALLDYPQVVSRLQALWATPTQTMQALEASLFRRDAGSSTFDLPAYRELLFLYSVARDLSERDATVANVDLLLPLGDEAHDPRPLTRLHPTVTPPTPAGRSTPVDLDLDVASLDAGPSERDDRPSRFHTDFSPTSGFLGLPGERAANAG